MMFDLGKMFDLSKTFAVPNFLLKSKKYCIVYFCENWFLS